MEKNIGPALKNSKTLYHVERNLVRLLKDTKNKNNTGKIGYVAGMISSDGSRYIKTNRKRLAAYTKTLRKLHGFSIFSAVDIFSGEVYSRLEMVLPFEKREVLFRRFWRKILKIGHITDVFMTPRWDKSKGATDEHKTAKEIGLKIHYVEDTH